MRNIIFVQILKQKTDVLGEKTKLKKKITNFEKCNSPNFVGRSFVYSYIVIFF